MYFKLIHEIGSEFFDKRNSPMVFEYKKPTVFVSIRSIKKANLGVVIETITQREPKPKVKKVFIDLQDGFYSNPRNTAKIVEDMKEGIDSEKKYGYTLPYDVLPKYFIEYYESISRDLFSYSSRTYNTIRWVEDIEGTNNPFINNKLLWSFDENNWIEFPEKFSVEIRARRGLYTSQKSLVSDIVQSGNSEPLYHELLREAHSLRVVFPRSALLIAISAAETGVKQCIARLQPETEWLLENTPSPNIIKLIRDYIPKLPLKIDPELNFSIPQETVLKPLEKAIQMRNKVAHGGKCKIKQEALKTLFNAIKNLLWILDFYAGNEWAVKHVGEEARTEIDKLKKSNKSI